MRKIIYNLRGQPEHVRRHVLHVATLVFGIILILLWIYSLGRTLTNTDNQAKVNQDLKPLSALKANIVGGYNNLSTPTQDDATQ